MLLRTLHHTRRTLPLVIEAAGQRYRQTTQFFHLGSLLTQATILCRRSNIGSDSHGHATVDSSGNCTIYRLPRSLRSCAFYKAEVMETLLCGCVTYTLVKDDFAEL